MLEHLEVSGLGIIDRVAVDLGEGFAALTGETGAGKSLLVESLKLLAGGRAQTDLVRAGEERLHVKGVFSSVDLTALDAALEEMGCGGDEGSVIIRREVTSSGRSRAWINDTGVSVSALQRIAPLLMSIHGQHEQHGLGDRVVQRQLVDAYGDHQPLVDETGAAYERWSGAANEVARLEAAHQRRRDRLDAIAFQLSEIDRVTPRDGEVEELEQRRTVLRHAVRLGELSRSALDRLSEGDSPVAGEIARAEREVSEMVACGLQCGEARKRLAEVRVLVDEAVREIQALSEGLAGDPEELEQIESRLFALEQLMLRFGSPLAAVLEHRDSLIQERSELEGVGDLLQTARAAAARALEDYAARAQQLDTARSEAGVRFAAAVEDVLARLNMGGTRLELRWEARPDETSPLIRDGRRVAFAPAGVLECELYIAANPGEEARPMAKVASGGELSRIHLAMRTVLRQRVGRTSLTLLFDEVDSGLGGRTAAALADLLAELAAADQVLVVTHLPQVAAAASAQYRVEKVMEQERAVTRVARLSDEEREIEVARMLAGKRASESARAHARELLGRR